MPRIATPDIVRLWAIGGTNNVVRFMEMLAAALFTLEQTGSGFAVAAVSAARTLPLLLLGALAGVLSESVNRKTIQAVGMAIVASSSVTVFLLARAGVVEPWHIALAAFVSGCVWSADMSTRRRMVGELAAPAFVSRVIALDSLAGALTRMIGPMLGAAAFGLIGLGGTYACSIGLTLLTALLLAPIRHAQVTKRLAVGHVPRDLAEGFAIARRDAVVRSVLAVTVAMNMFGFSYAALVAPIGRQVFQVSSAMVGLLAAAEPLGALIGGLALAMRTPAMSPRLLFLGGSSMFMLAAMLMPLAPEYALACGVLVLGGLGTAGFSNMQTTLIITGAPVAVRSRLMGLITVCIGTGPLGVLLVGALADWIGPMAAVMGMAMCGLGALALAWVAWVRSDP
ncbi:MFS transporter [Limobrevibacterium gyesilva]|uniref:MFS transporter n=1 Tax=Limobrevibacterium gyesilva TaxID=2991712 RepID=A0AA41YL24_9PROT|nr:MFS transporter [Limobrevibacterium gyesilva]